MSEAADRLGVNQSQISRDANASNKKENINETDGDDELSDANASPVDAFAALAISDVAEWATKKYGRLVTPRMVRRCSTEFRAVRQRRKKA